MTGIFVPFTVTCGDAVALYVDSPPGTKIPPLPLVDDSDQWVLIKEEPCALDVEKKETGLPVRELSPVSLMFSSDHDHRILAGHTRLTFIHVMKC
jgi:hypothetical protein